MLTNLVRQTPTQVLAALQAGDVDLNPGDTEEKTKNILRCIGYSHSNLSPEAQQLLSCLAPFTSVIYLNALKPYTTHLRKQPILATLPFERWSEVVQEAQHWGLLTPDPDIPDFLRLQPVLPYFLRTRLHTPEQAETQTAVETAFRELYDQHNAELYRLLSSKEPQERLTGQVLTALEYENLVTALNLALSAQISIENPYFALSAYLDTTQDHQRGLELGQTVLKSLEAYPADKLGAEFVSIIQDIGTRQFNLKRYAEAEESYQDTVHIDPCVVDCGDESQRENSILRSRPVASLGALGASQRAIAANARAIAEGTGTHCGVGTAENAAACVRESHYQESAWGGEEGSQETGWEVQPRETTLDAHADRGASDRLVSGLSPAFGRHQSGTSARSDRYPCSGSGGSDPPSDFQRLVCPVPAMAGGPGGCAGIRAGTRTHRSAAQQSDRDVAYGDASAPSADPRPVAQPARL